jgi:hypothetical protein
MKIVTHQVDGVWERFPGTPQLTPAAITRLLADGVWTWRDLYKNGLQAAEPFKVPDGKRIVPGAVERFSEDGKAQLFEVEDAPPPPVPQAIYPLQARKALRAAGLFDAVQAHVASLSAEEQDEWEYALEIRRDHPVIVNGATALGLTKAQVDDLFRLGATL